MRLRVENGLDFDVEITYVCQLPYFVDVVVSRKPITRWSKRTLRCVFYRVWLGPGFAHQEFDVLPGTKVKLFAYKFDGTLYPRFHDFHDPGRPGELSVVLDHVRPG